MFPSLRDRTVLVTGHTGFVGSWLVLWLHALGARVWGYALDPPTSPSHFALADLGDLLVRDVRGDVRRKGVLAQVMADARPDLVFHLAAQSLVREGIRRPLPTFDVNVMGTVSLLEALRDRGTPAVIVTSDKCYAPRSTPHVEGDAMGGDDPYAASKGAAELAVAAWRATYGLPVATVRAGNILGGGDFAPFRLQTDLVAALRAGRPVRIRAPDAVRPWQHVLDPLRGMLLLAERLLLDPSPRWCTGWNLGPSDLVPVRDVVERYVRAWGGGEWSAFKADFPETPVLALSSEKVYRELGWEPRIDLDEAVERSVAWFRALEAGRDMRAVSEQEIADQS